MLLDFKERHLPCHGSAYSVPVKSHQQHIELHPALRLLLKNATNAKGKTLEQTSDGVHLSILAFSASSCTIDTARCSAQKVGNHLQTESRCKAQHNAV